MIYFKAICTYRYFFSSERSFYCKSAPDTVIKRGLWLHVTHHNHPSHVIPFLLFSQLLLLCSQFQTSHVPRGLGLWSNLRVFPAIV